MRRLLSSTIRGDRPVPVEYLEYLMCVKLHKLPAELGSMDEADFGLFLGFMRAEAEADRMKTFQSKHYDR